MRHLRLGVMVSGGGTTMQNLAEVIARGELDARIVCCIASNSHCRGIERARKLGIPVHMISRKEAGTIEEFSARNAAALREHNVDLALMAGYLSLWTIPEEFRGRVMNIHPALLPKFGGKGMHGEHVHAAVLASGEKESGCTVHFADNTYDGGPIILQRHVPVRPTDTAETLAKRVFEQECRAYPAAVKWFGEDVLVFAEPRAYLRKVLAYITREREGRTELLVFDHVHHREAGVQVPHGTVHNRETIEEGLVREVREETGLEGLEIVRALGEFTWEHPTWHVQFRRHVFQMRVPAGRELPGTWDWYETDGGRREKRPEYLFRYRWIPLEPGIRLAAHQAEYLGPLLQTP